MMTKHVLGGIAAILIASSAAQAVTVYALTDDNSLLSFDSSDPLTLSGVGIIKTPSNTATEDLIGIDFRPSDNQLYAVGKFGTLYTINITTAVATPVASLFADGTDTTSPFTGLVGTRFGFDFNPFADRLRITSDLDQNLRINVGTGATTTDGTLNPGNPTIVASAYTNNFAGTGSTALYNIDSVTNSLYIQTPPNVGTQSLVGALGIDISSLNGFDIVTVGSTNIGYASLQNSFNGVSDLYQIDLVTGAATPLGTIGGGDFIDGLAVAIPEPATIGFLAMGLPALLRRRRTA